MPSKWFDHAADPLDPNWIDDDETVQDFTQDDQGSMCDILMHCGHQGTPAGSGVYFIQKVYGRSPECPGQFVQAFGLAHSSETMQVQHRNVSGATEATIGSALFLHLCAGPGFDCVARREH